MTDKIEVRKLNELHKIHKAIENNNCNCNVGGGNINQNTNDIDLTTDNGIKKLFEIILVNSSEQSLYNIDYENSSEENKIYLSDKDILESVKQNQIISVDEIGSYTPINTIFTCNKDVDMIGGMKEGIYFRYNSQNNRILGVFLFTINNMSYCLLKGAIQTTS